MSENKQGFQSANCNGHLMGSQRPSPNVKTLCNFEPQIWPEMITSRDVKSACFKGSSTSCDVRILVFFLSNFGRITSRDGCFLLI